jgi:hypothetical protein
MSEERDDTQCDTGQMSARRIALQDGRYMIFFEFGDTSPEPSAEEGTAQEKSEYV